MISGLTSYPQTVPFPDPAGDITFVVARVPEGNGQMTLKGASLAFSTTVDADGSNHIAATLYKNGIDGEATPVAVSSILGGASVDWTANHAREFVLDADEVVCLAGEYLTLAYNETGSVAPGMGSLCLDFAPGVAA